jgi:hypothetical protein
MEPRNLGKYHLLGQIGRGGMGTVYKALDEMLDRVVAIKMINADLLEPAILQRFRGEAVTLAKLSHPRIATIYELAKEGNDLLMVMEYVEGETCEQYLTQRGPLEISNASFICDQVLDALQHAHGAGIVHRDLKPSNVMMTATGDIKVMDFGIARAVGSQHLTMDGHMMGTPAYMAPEQIRGEEVDGRSDLYSATVMFYRLLTQHLPFKADTAVALIHSQLADYPTPSSQFRKDLPEWVDRILQRGLAKDRNARFQTAAEFRYTLQSGLVSTMTRMTRPVIPSAEAETKVFQTPANLRQAGAPRTGTQPVPATGGMPVGTSATSATGTMTATGATTTATSNMPTQTVAIPANAVVVQKPYMMIGAALLALLVIGVGALAVIELRRPATSTAVAPAASPAQTQAPAPGSASAPSPGSTASTSAPPPATPPAPSPADTTPVSAPARPTTAATPRAGGDDSTPVVDRAARPAPARAAAAPPVVADVPQSFGNVKTVMLDGTKERELDALLALEGGNLIVRSRDSGAVLKTMPYRSVAAATYTHAKRPRSNDAAGIAVVPENLGGGGLLGSAKNWLTVQSKTDFLILRLDEDRSVQTVLAAIESRTGTKVDQPDRDK